MDFTGVKYFLSADVTRMVLRVPLAWVELPCQAERPHAPRETLQHFSLQCLLLVFRHSKQVVITVLTRTIIKLIVLNVQQPPLDQTPVLWILQELTPPLAVHGAPNEANHLAACDWGADLVLYLVTVSRTLHDVVAELVLGTSR